jgi:hypothetical protein
MELDSNPRTGSLPNMSTLFSTNQQLARPPSASPAGTLTVAGSPAPQTANHSYTPHAISTDPDLDRYSHGADPAKHLSHTMSVRASTTLLPARTDAAIAEAPAGPAPSPLAISAAEGPGGALATPPTTANAGVSTAGQVTAPSSTCPSA